MTWTRAAGGGGGWRTDGGLLTFQVIGFAAVVAQLLEQEPQDGGGGAAVLPVGGGLVVEQHGVGLAALDEALLVLVVGDDGADGQVALLQAAEHEPGDGQVDGRLDVRALEQLVGAAVEQQQRAAAARLQLLLQPLRALARHRRSHGRPRGAPPDLRFHGARQRRPPAPGPPATHAAAGRDRDPGCGCAPLLSPTSGPGWACAAPDAAPLRTAVECALACGPERGGSRSALRGAHHPGGLN